MSLAIYFMLGQGLASIPALPAGSTVMVVAEDLRTIYATGIVEGGRLVFDRSLPPGEYLQLVIYPAQAAPMTDATSAAKRSAEGPATSAPPVQSAAPAASSFAPQSLRVRVGWDGLDLFLVVDGSSGDVSLSDWLASNRNLSMVVPAP